MAVRDVILCKDCDHWRCAYFDTERSCHRKVWPDESPWYTPPHGYCHDAEPKKEDRDDR